MSTNLLSPVPASAGRAEADSVDVDSAELALPKILVANRGEIALRIIRTIQESGRQAVAVYADQDLNAPFVRLADEAYSLGGSTAGETYLSGDKILEVAKRAQVSAIHPGYGFLAENPLFARQVEEAGLVWIGPDAAVIEMLGDKIRARQSALEANVSPVPGTHSALEDKEEVIRFVEQWGYPVVLKAADGGGGRGIHVLRQDGDLDNFFATWVPGSSKFFVERYVEKARHLETQSARDSHGNFALYSTRDCSVQRRHQKLIEEAPAPNLSPVIAQQLKDSSQALFEASGYVGLGTCEFLLSSDGELYFLEVNPRLQVEHTVTEEVSGVDLVDAQLRIAAGEPLPTPQPVRGHSIELRVTSEDPYHDLAPSLGTLEHVAWPTGPGIRIDTGVVAGDTISPEFDSMVAKLIVWAPSRGGAIKRALRAIAETEIAGIQTPLPLYRHILQDPQFSEGVWTRWLESGVLETFGAKDGETGSTAGIPASPAETEAVSRQKILIEIDGRRVEVVIPGDLFATAPTRKAPQPLRQSRESRRTPGANSDDAITAPTQAIVVRLGAKPGDHVESGDVLVVLESMKMESYVNAPRAGRLESIAVGVGDNVSPGQVLAVLEGESDEL